MGEPKRPASQIKSDLGRAPPAKHDAKHDGHRGPLLHYILGGGDHPPRGTRQPPRGTRHSPPGTRDGLDVGRGTASTWDEGAPLAWDTLVLGHRRAWDSLLGTNGRLNQLNTSKLKKKKSKDNLLEATPPARTRDGLAVGRGGG